VASLYETQKQTAATVRHRRQPPSWSV